MHFVVFAVVRRYVGRYQAVDVEPQVTVSEVTESNAVVTWKAIEDLPDDIKQYYKYILKYRLAEQSYVEFATLDHNPDASNSQRETLTGLEYGQRYFVQVMSVRVVRGQTEETGNTTDVQFTTKCLGTSTYMPTEQIGLSYLVKEFEVCRPCLLPDVALLLWSNLCSMFN